MLSVFGLVDQHNDARSSDSAPHHTTAQPLCPPSTDWHRLSEDQQLTVTRAALQLAMRAVAGQADRLALEIEGGLLRDRGGPDALRLLATTLRVVTNEPAPTAASDPCQGLSLMPIAGHA